MARLFSLLASAFIILFNSSIAGAWGRHGHEMVASVAAILISEEPEMSFMRERAYDMGYYANAPDIVWKSDPETYKKESPQHYFDLDVYQKTVTDADWNSNRVEFLKKFSQFPPFLGRAPWRISELEQKLKDVTGRLMKSDIKEKDAHQKLQGEWMVIAGVIGHYVGDLAQPLHCTEDYDGKGRGQVGLHSFFEDTVVSALYPEIFPLVLQAAKKQFKEFDKKNTSLDSFKMSLNLCKDSLGKLEQTFSLDKKTKRDVKAAAKAYRELVIQRLALGSVYLATIWKRNLGWKYQGERFYFFSPAPQYLDPVVEPATTKTL